METPAQEATVPGDDTPAPASLQPLQQPQQSLTMQQVNEALLACLAVLEGESDEKQQRRDARKIIVGTTVIRQICSGQLALAPPLTQTAPAPNRRQRRATAAASRAKPQSTTQGKRKARKR